MVIFDGREIVQVASCRRGLSPGGSAMLFTVDVIINACLKGLGQFT